MATQTVTDPVLLDSTGQLIKSALLQIKDAVQPTNVGVDMPLSIPVSAWPNSAPYEFTWLSTKVTPECIVSVGYGEGAENIDTLYLYATKVAGGVKFTTPEKPVTAIPVVIHILNAAAESITAVDADMVATDAVNGASNVDQALSVLDTEIGDLTNLATTEKGSLVGAANELKNTTNSQSQDIATLNSNISRTRITTNTDMNTLTVPNGLPYRDVHYEGDDVTKLTNRPAVNTATPFLLDVMRMDAYNIQRLTIYSTRPRVFERRQYYDSGVLLGN